VHHARAGRGDIGRCDRLITQLDPPCWIKRYIFFHGKRHPAEMGEAEIGRFYPVLRPIST